MGKDEFACSVIDGSSFKSSALSSDSGCQRVPISDSEALDVEVTPDRRKGAVSTSALADATAVRTRRPYVLTAFTHHRTGIPLTPIRSASGVRPR